MRMDPTMNMVLVPERQQIMAMVLTMPPQQVMMGMEKSCRMRKEKSQPVWKMLKTLPKVLMRLRGSDGERLPEGKRLDAEVLQTVDGDDGVEDAVGPAVAELADETNDHEVVEVELRGVLAVDLWVKGERETDPACGASP